MGFLGSRRTSAGCSSSNRSTSTFTRSVCGQSPGQQTHSLWGRWCAGFRDAERFPSDLLQGMHVKWTDDFQSHWYVVGGTLPLNRSRNHSLAWARTGQFPSRTLGSMGSIGWWFLSWQLRCVRSPFTVGDSNKQRTGNST